MQGGEWLACRLLRVGLRPRVLSRGVGDEFCRAYCWPYLRSPSIGPLLTEAGKLEHQYPGTTSDT